jgi:hypothetical protein
MLIGGSNMFPARAISHLLVFGAAFGIALTTGALDRVQASSSQDPQRQSAESSTPTPLVGVLNTYCTRCHDQRTRTAGLALDRMDPSAVASQAETWEKVIQKLHAGTMPPAGLPRPDKAATDAAIAWLETELDRAAALAPNPGRTEAVHRLNRAEYANAIRDLLALEVDASSLLPADNADVNGFDNSASLLSISPALLERYLSAARKISRVALAIPPAAPVTDVYAAADLAQQDSFADENLPFGSRGGLAIHHYFPVDGEYLIKVRLRRQIYDYITGLDRRERLEVRVDGERVKSFAIGGEDHGRTAPQSFAGDVLGSPEWEKYALNADAELEVRARVKAGPRLVGVAFVGQFTEPEGVVQPRQRYGDYSRDESRPQGLENVAIAGPYGVTAATKDTPSLNRLLTCRPARRGDEEPCAKQILSRLARHAFRRPVEGAEVDALMDFYKTGRLQGTFIDGLQFGLERLLADPSFLFRVERDPPSTPPGTVYPLTDLDLASRLSFFLWSSIPDDELLAAAVEGKLRDAAGLERQARRMLADDRARALLDNFAGQWLLLRNVRSARPDPDLFPDFDEELRMAFQRETELFLDSQMRGDRSVAELLSANYTFVNERLARHYQIPNIHGNHFRRVTFGPSEPRGGLLGQGSVLLVTSYPNRTSPVLRGKWVLDSIMGTPPPQPPPNVPSLKDRDENGRTLSVRQRLEEHRKMPGCASCHAPMDPLGFALENFDAIGKWRTTGEGGAAIDASAALPSGVHVDGPLGLRTTLLGQREQFAAAVTEKLLSYALGRSIEYFDRPAIRTIVRKSAAADYRWSAIVAGIVRSAPFQMRKAR